MRSAMVATAVLAVLSGGAMLASIDFHTRRVDRSHLTIETVQQGMMDVKVSADGQLLARHIEQLATQVSGRVVRADIKPGAFVHVGDVLVELTNPQLVDSAREAESAWQGAVAELSSAQAELQSNALNEELALTQARFNLAKAQVQTEADEALARDGLLSGIELKRSHLNLSQLKDTYAIEQDRVQKLHENTTAQLAVRRSRVAQLAQALDRSRSQVSSLKIVAGINGIVQAIDVQVGQQLAEGSPIGRIAQQNQLYAELKVPAREATQVQTGQRAVIDTRNGLVNGVVSRVDPGVTDGTVVVDVDLRAPLPAGARPQLPVEGSVYVTEIPNTLFVGKPAYVKDDSALSVYKLDANGHYANRVKIRSGKISLNYMQVLQGLQPGDRIITSEVGDWQGEDRILLK